MFLCIPIDENEYIIGELANIIKDQSYRMQDNLQDVDEYAPPEVPQKRIAANNKKQSSFTYDLESNLPEINTGNREIPFAVLPNDRRYYQTGSDNGCGCLFSSSVFDRTVHAD